MQPMIPEHVMSNLLKYLPAKDLAKVAFTSSHLSMLAKRTAKQNAKIKHERI